MRSMPLAHWPWLVSRANLVPDGQFRAIEAVDEASGKILAAVGYDGWMDNACCMHVALDHPSAGRYVLRPAFRIPFVELGLGVVVAKVVSTNVRALALDKALGFKVVGVGRDWIRPGVDLVVMEMRREDCRWLLSRPKRAAKREAA